MEEMRQLAELRRLELHTAHSRSTVRSFGARWRRYSEYSWVFGLKARQRQRTAGGAWPKLGTCLSSMREGDATCGGSQLNPYLGCVLSTMSTSGGPVPSSTK
jgi:hypothetical protein